MEIPGAGSAQLLLDAAVGRAEGARLDLRAGVLEGTAETREGLEKAAKEFEGVFLNQLLKAMRATVPDNELFNTKGATKFYRQMHDAEMARALADGHSGMGISDLIVHQFEQRVAAEEGTIGDPGTETTEKTSLPEAVSPLALRRYRESDGVGDRTEGMIRLRRLAEIQEPATADTLRRYEAGFSAAGRETGVDPALLLAVTMEESGGDSAAVSRRGAVGLMQLMPGTAEEVGVVDPRSPEQNLAGGARYLARMLDRYPGRPDLALAAYNAGPGAVDRAGKAVPPYPETQRYVGRVLERYRELGGTDLAKDSP